MSLAVRGTSSINMQGIDLRNTEHKKLPVCLPADTHASDPNSCIEEDEIGNKWLTSAALVTLLVFVQPIAGLPLAESYCGAVAVMFIFTCRLDRAGEWGRSPPVRGQQVRRIERGGALDIVTAEEEYLALVPARVKRPDVSDDYCGKVTCTCQRDTRVCWWVRRLTIKMVAPSHVHII